MISDGSHWIFYDPMMQGTMIEATSRVDFDAVQFQWDQGNIVVPARICIDFRTPAPYMPYTCVEAVKRVLGIRAWSICTPWRLYQFLIMEGQ